MYNRFIIYKVLEVNETLDDTVNKLSRLSKEDLHFEKVSDWRYIFLANESYGTLMKYGITGGIRLYVYLDYIDENNTQIEIKTKPRLELILFVIMWLGVIISQISGNTDFYIWIHLINAILLLFGWFFYRKQEISLLNISEPKIKNALQYVV